MRTTPDELTDNVCANYKTDTPRDCVCGNIPTGVTRLTDTILYELSLPFRLTCVRLFVLTYLYDDKTNTAESTTQDVLGRTFTLYIAITGIELNKNTANLTIGDSEQLIATIYPQNATNQNITWSSSNTSVATVDNGLLKGISVGTATITATTADGNKTANCNVTVQPSSSGMELIDPTNIRIYPNPADDQLIIEHATAKHILIYTIDGRKAYENPNPSEKEIIAVSAWNIGLYIVQIQMDSDVVLTEKVIKSDK
jgi:transglutaminase/protease-like cytokinesis protein 3